MNMEGKTREERLEHALRRVLEWPLPARDGSEETVATWALPGWLADMAREALAEDGPEKLELGECDHKTWVVGCSGCGLA